MEKSDRISSAFIVFVPNKSLIIALIRFFGLRFFSRRAKGRDKIVWSVRFRRARRTIVRRAAKSDAEKAKTSNPMQESVRIPTPFSPYGTHERLISSACFRFFGPDDFSRHEQWRDKKDAESSKIVTSPYKRTAEAIFGRRFFSLPHHLNFRPET